MYNVDEILKMKMLDTFHSAKQMAKEEIRKRDVLGDTKCRTC